MTLKVCAEPACPELLPQGTARCARHKRKPWDHHGVSRHARGYGAQWQRIRAQVLAEEPWCAYCGEPSTTVDHIIPKKEGGTDDRANLCGACARCQQSKAGREGQRARA